MTGLLRLSIPDLSVLKKKNLVEGQAPPPGKQPNGSALDISVLITEFSSWPYSPSQYNHACHQNDSQLKGHSVRKLFHVKSADVETIWKSGRATRFNRCTVGDKRQQFFDAGADLVKTQKDLPLSHFVNDTR